MPQTKSRRHYAFDRPGNYRIRVEGFLDKSRSESLGDMRISTASRGDQGSVTVLDGCVRDQAELVGLVNTLYGLHLTLLSVEYMDEE